MIAAHLPVPAVLTRCFCCGARAWAKEASGWKRCAYCDISLPIDEKLLPAELATSLRATLVSGKMCSEPVGESHWQATYRTLRIAGTTHKMWLTGSWQAQHQMAGSLGDILELQPFSAFAPANISLVVLCRINDPALSDLIDRYAQFFHDVVVVFDSRTDGCRSNQRITYISRPLDGDFASQRNVGTQRAVGDWVLHLDTDEGLSDDFCLALPHLASAAENSGYVTVGFPRRNYVDGRISDLFPDIQFRLIKRDVLFEGNVHERPVSCVEGSRTIVSQHGLIDHHLEESRIAARSEFYDRLGQETARHTDDHALRSPFVS